MTASGGSWSGGGGGSFYAGGGSFYAGGAGGNSQAGQVGYGGGGSAVVRPPADMCPQFAHRPTGIIESDAADELFSACACGKVRWYRRNDEGGDREPVGAGPRRPTPLSGRAELPE